MWTHKKKRLKAASTLDIEVLFFVLVVTWGGMFSPTIVVCHG